MECKFREINERESNPIRIGNDFVDTADKFRYLASMGKSLTIGHRYN